MNNKTNNFSNLDNQEPLIDVEALQTFSDFMHDRESEVVSGDQNRFIMYIRKDDAKLILKGEQSGFFKQLNLNQQAIIQSYYDPTSLDISFKDILNLQRTVFGNITQPYINLIVRRYKEKHGIDLAVEGNIEIFLGWIMQAIEHNYIGPVPAHQTQFFGQKTDIVGTNAYLAAAMHNVNLYHQNTNLQENISQDYLSYRQFVNKIATIFKTDKKDNSMDFVRQEVLPMFINKHQNEYIDNLAVYTDDGGFVSNYYSKTSCEKCLQEAKELITPKGYRSVDKLKNEFMDQLFLTVNDSALKEYSKIRKGELMKVLLWTGMYNEIIVAGTQALESNQDYKDFQYFIAGLGLSEVFGRYVRVEIMHKGRGKPIEKRMSINECCSLEQAKKITQYIEEFKERKGL